MRRSIARSFVGLLVVCACSATLTGAGARFWEVATLPDFLKGDVTNLSIDLHGRLVLGPSLTELAAPTAPVLWKGLTSDDGTLYLGSGNDGQVLRIARDGKLSVFFDSAELEVHALAHAPGNGLYVGTSPDGRIYKVDRNGKATTFFDPDDKYIWSLAVDDQGFVYAATGDKGVIYRISPDGKGEPFYRTRATHVRALHVADDGSLLVGTESPGRVFRVGADGNGFLLLDSGLQEVSALKPGPQGVVYAAALTGNVPDRPAAPPPAEQPRTTSAPTVSTEITAMAVVDQAPPAAAPSGPVRESGSTSGRGAVYRIQPDGVWDQVWSSGEDAPYDVAIDGDGGLLVATGGDGKIYRVSGEPSQTTLLARAPAQQVTSLMLDGPRGLLVATANPAKVFRMSNRAAESGAYESEVRDAQSLATWGAISWRGLAPVGTDVRLFTRSGNTQAPDDTWSPWSSAYRNPDGEQITSPKARYLQWKLELVGKDGRTPVVTSVTAAYLQRNLRPEIASITIHPPGVVFQKPFSSGETEIAGYDAGQLDRRPGAAPAPTGTGTPALGRRGYQKGLQTVIWKAEDENEDDLTFDVLYRREGETVWKPLKRNLLDPIFVWDTTSVPNGTYVIKITATDATANPPGSALVAERESGTFDIDNTPPTITVLSATRSNGRTAVRFVVRDFDSPVQRVEYALDADRWRPIYPKDGIADSRIEEFELTLDGDTVDKAIILRAVDAMNNVATGRAEPLDPERGE